MGRRIDKIEKMEQSIIREVVHQVCMEKGRGREKGRETGVISYNFCTRQVNKNKNIQAQNVLSSDLTILFWNSYSKYE